MSEKYSLKILKKNHVGKLYLDTMNTLEVKKYIDFASKNKRITKKKLIQYIQNLKKKNIFLGIFNNKNKHVANVKIDYSIKDFATIGFLVFNGFRGKKIIQKNFDKIINLIKDKKFNLDKLYLGVNPKNIPAVKLYKKLGFKKTNEKKNFYCLEISNYDYTEKDVLDCFNKIKLKKGDNVYVNPELFRFGYLKNFTDKKKYFKLFLDLIIQKIGKNGTVSLNSYTFQTLRHNKPFVYEKSKSSSGGLSEYFRNLKGTVRSDHPVFSVTSKGKNKNFISKNNSQNNYGAGSPYERFLKLNGKILNLGMDFHLNPFLHHIEFIYSVPYFYNKLTRVKYFKNQKRIKKDFISSVRYYDLEYLYNLKPIIDKLKKVNFIQSEQLGNGYVHLYSAKKYCEVIKKLLDKNVLALVKNVKFQKGKYPYK